MQRIGQHDIGGDLAESLPADLTGATDNPTQLWEKRVHASLGLLSRKKLMTVDEMRRGIEQLPESSYKGWSYYEKWAASMMAVCLERGTLKNEDLDGVLFGKDEQAEEVLSPGDRVVVRTEKTATRWQRPHLRTPGYIFGCHGVIERVVGRFPFPEELAFNRPAPSKTLYRVRFAQAAVWPEYKGHSGDSVDVEIYSPWLTAAKDAEEATAPSARVGDKRKHPEAQSAPSSSHGHSHGHGHGHGAGSQPHVHDDGTEHTHEERVVVEQTAVEREGSETPGQRVAEAFVDALITKGVISPAEMTAALEAFDRMGKNGEGAKLVARAWCDDEFKSRLLADGNAAAKELGIMASNSHTHTQLLAVANTPDVHNVVVCTLCSCYPISILGPSPAWYKSRGYRARVVREPRQVLEEFGTILPDNTAIHVHDSTADCRYMVVPMRPPGTEGMSEEQLAGLVTRDSMIGVRVL